MYRFFVHKWQMVEGEVRITGGDFNHIRNVLRMKPGDTVLISTGDEWEYTCRIQRFEPEEAVLRVEDAQKPGKELPSRIYLFQCLPKGDKMETVVQKAVELGAFAVIPVASRRCVVKLDERRGALKTERWNSIAESAAKQAKRMIIPEVKKIRSFGDALAYAQEMDVRLIPYEKADGMGATRKTLMEIRPGQSVAVMIGPEGGFEDSEIEMAKNAGFQPITLGRRILRTETAGMTALSILMFLLERD